MTKNQPLELSVDLAMARERETAWNLLQFYMHDFSEFAAADDPHGVIGADGHFPDDKFESYWRGDPSRCIYFFRVAGNLAGFAHVNDWSLSGEPVDFALAEFFVLRKYRRNGIGRRAARDLFQRHGGTWELGATFYNEPALAFWRRSLPDLDVGDLRHWPSHAERWQGTIFRFRSGAEAIAETA